MNRRSAVQSIMKPILKATQDPTKYTALGQVALDQYSKGNIVVIPKDLFTQFLVSKGINIIIKQIPLNPENFFLLYNIEFQRLKILYI
ncbi:MAG: hypothetical protein PHY59_01180 [Methanobacterium sp.]|nr:hypothetical protein [Methanobacterium sp.]